MNSRGTDVQCYNKDAAKRLIEIEQKDQFEYESIMYRMELEYAYRYFAHLWHKILRL
jgi:hypothetical protein